MARVTIKTDNKWKYFKYGYELPRKARKEFDYVDDEEFDSMSFIKYRNWWYSLNDFMRVSSGRTEFRGWDGYHSDSYFSGIVIKVSGDSESYKIGTYYS